MDLIIDRNLYRELLELHGEEGIDAVIGGDIIKKRQAAFKNSAAADNPPKP